MSKRYIRKVIIYKVRKPTTDDIDKALNWLFTSLGIEDKPLSRKIFREIIKASFDNEGVSSRELADETDVTQAAVVYHLNVFRRLGLVVRRGREYYLRGGSLEQTLDEIENDMVRRLRRMKDLAGDIENRWEKRYKEENSEDSNSN